MTIPFFVGQNRRCEKLFLPLAYRRSVKWLPQIGDIFPDFHAEITDAEFRFFDWAEGHWTFLFSHPAAFTPVCTTELIALAAMQEDFDARNVKLLGFTGSSREKQAAWHADIEKKFGYHIGFPTIADENATLARAFGMIHEKESDAWPIRKSFILDPEMRIRLIFEYPIYVGRSTDEVLRSIDALQAVDRYGLAVPADWQPGEDLVYAENDDAVGDARAVDTSRNYRTPYLSLVQMTS